MRDLLESELIHVYGAGGCGSSPTPPTSHGGSHGGGSKAKGSKSKGSKANGSKAKGSKGKCGCVG